MGKGRERQTMKAPARHRLISSRQGWGSAGLGGVVEAPWTAASVSEGTSLLQGAGALPRAAGQGCGGPW